MNKKKLYDWGCERKKDLAEMAKRVETEKKQKNSNIKIDFR